MTNPPDPLDPQQEALVRIAKALRTIAESPLVKHPLLTIAGAILAAGLISAIFSLILAAIFV